MQGVTKALPAHSLRLLHLIKFRFYTCFFDFSFALGYVYL